MKKLLAIILVFVFALSLTAVLVACKPGKLEDIVGTYQLVVDEETEYEKETVNKLEKYQKEVYIVLTGEEIGYYVYKDKDTPVTAIEIKVEYFKEDNGKVASIRFKTGTGESPVSYNVDAREEICLVSRWPQPNKIMKGFDIKYKKISEKADLTEVKKVFKNLPVYEYGMIKYDKIYSGDLVQPWHNFYDYVYRMIDIDASQKKATIYYALKSDKTPVVLRDLPVVFTADEEGSVTGVTIGEEEYSFDGLSFKREVTVEIEGAPSCKTEIFNTRYDIDSDDLNDAYFAELLATYEASLAEGSSQEG